MMTWYLYGQTSFEFLPIKVIVFALYLSAVIKLGGKGKIFEEGEVDERNLWKSI
mgnify:CR=1 FL=1